MKKAFSFALGLVVAISALFVSCADGGNDGGGNNDLFCNVSVTNTVGGSVSITDYLDNSSKVLIGADIEVVANPESGYEFIGWFIDNSTTPVSTNTTFKFVASRDVALVAKFKKVFTVSVQSAGNGSVAIKDISDKSLELLIGSEITVVATPAANCDFLGWFVGDAETPVSTDATYTFTLAENTTLVAKFSKWPLVLISSGGNGTVSFENSSELSQFVQLGSDVTVVATPAANCDFLGWFVGDSEEPVSTEATYTFTVNESVALVAKFNKWPLVSISSAGNGTVSFDNSAELFQYVQPGSELTVVAAPDANYDFLGWFVGDAETPVSTEATYTFTVNESVALVAKFNKWPLVSISSAGNGTVSFDNSAELFQYVQPGSELTVVAAPDANYDFLGWFVGDAETPVSTEATYTFTVEEEVSLVAKFEGRKTYIDGYEYVDLGLPSGIKWAAYNVGATKPEEYGGYYAWGETEEKSNYSWSTYKWYNGSYNTMTKYCTDSSSGTVDNKTVLDPEDDVAHVKWGGSWRMPTKAEQDELRNKCSWQWTTLNGVNGYRVTGPNGNSIFLPAAGYRYGTSLNGEGSGGDCWSSTPYESNSYYACYLYFYSNNYDWGSDPRFCGRGVRPVLE